MLLADSQKACGKLTCMVISAGTANVMLELICGRSSAKAYDSTPSSWECILSSCQLRLSALPFVAALSSSKIKASGCLVT